MNYWRILCHVVKLEGDLTDNRNESAMILKPDRPWGNTAKQNRIVLR